MAVTAALYGNVFLAAFNKEIDFLSDDVRLTLHTVGYVPDQDADDYVDDLSNEVAAGGGYATGGEALANKTLTYTGATNVVKLDADDVTWAGSTITARVAVVSDRETAVDATSPLICYQLSDADIVSTGGDWTCQWDADGIVEITVGAPA